MADRRSKTARPLSAVALGLAGTGLVVALHLAGLFDRLELQALDLRFRTFPTAPAAEQILHVDIDDRSLDEMGAWPWPRSEQAGIVEILESCGARSVVLDIILPHPRPVRYESAADDIYGGPAERVGAAPLRVFDDAALAETLGRYSNIYLPMHIEPGVRQNELDSRVAEALAAEPDASLETIRQAVLPASQPETYPPRFRRAYLRARAIAALKRFGIDADQAAGLPVIAGRLVPPLAAFAASIRRTGFVTFKPDRDGVLRRIPLLAKADGELFPQFALAVAVAELAARHGEKAEISADRTGVMIRCADGFELRVPSDGDGFLLINWLRARPGLPGLEQDPPHISAAAVGFVWRLRRDLEKISRLGRLYQLQLAQTLGQAELVELFARADALYDRKVAHQVRRQQMIVYEPAEPAPPVPEELLQAERQVEQQIDAAAAELLDDFYLQGATDEDVADVRALRWRLKALPDQAERIRERIDQELARLRPLVAGKICLVGSTATGAADFVPTPVSERSPGVVVHANILNTILSGAFIRRAHPAAEIATIILAGMIISLLAATQPVLVSGPVMLLAAGGYSLLNGWHLFGSWGVWLVVVAPVAAMAGSFAVVTAYRQLTEERAKRRIRGLFAHALSPTLVDRLIENPDLAKLGGEKRVMSFFFSDLAGFATVAERLGEQQTVTLLNHYFDHMTEVIQNRFGGYLNKFLGDGLFVFFGAPVFQEDHARRAIEAAVAAQEAVARLNAEIAGKFDHPVQLACRIGISTGEAMVGNCGSSERMDYTAIGDAVNLASRLDSANKFFGTRILVTDQTLRAGGEGILARPLGKVQVVGRAEPATVWEVLAADGEADDELKQLCRRSEKAIGLFRQRNFQAAAETFESIQSLRPDDKPASIYLDICRKLAGEAPPADWDGAIELTEK